MNRFKLVVLLIIFSIALVNPIFIGCGEKKEQNVINVACNLPLTGDLSTYGEAIRNGVLLALDDISKSKNENDPFISFDWQDNAGQPRNAVSIFQKQFTKKVDIYVSGVKPQTMAIIDEIQKTSTPHFVWIFDAFVTRDYKNTLRTWVSYKHEPEYYLKYAKVKNPKKVAIIYVNLPHAEEEFNKLVIPTLKEMGVQNIFTEAYDWNKRDYKDIANKVKSFNPDLIIFNGFKSTIIGLVRAFRELNLIKDANTICTYDMLDAAEELSPNVIEGIRVIAPKFNTRADETTLIEWKKKFENKYRVKPKYTDAYAYDMALIINDVSKRIEKNATPEQWYKSILETEITGITGKLKFDEDGDLMIDLEIGVFRDGKLIPDNTIF